MDHGIVIFRDSLRLGCNNTLDGRNVWKSPVFSGLISTWGKSKSPSSTSLKSRVHVSGVHLLCLSGTAAPATQISEGLSWTKVEVSSLAYWWRARSICCSRHFNISTYIARFNVVLSVRNSLWTRPSESKNTSSNLSMQDFSLRNFLRFCDPGPWTQPCSGASLWDCTSETRSLYL